MTEPALPGMPEPPARTNRRATPNVRASRTAQRHLCQRCCQLIHALGQAVAPYPRGGRWRFVDGETVTFLCDMHLPDEPESGP